jgi:hypothetical protein
MLSPLRNRFGIPGVISVIALVFAMLGGAYAANNDNGGDKATASAKGKQGPPGKRGKPGPAGPAGPAGPQGPAGAKGDTGSAGSNGSNGAPGADGKSVVTTSFTGLSEPAGEPCNEFGGMQVEVQGSGVKKFVCNGKEGEPGETGDPWSVGGTLPPNATETGVWNVGMTPEGVFNPVFAELSFTVQLDDPLAASNVHYINEAGKEMPGEATPTACSGAAGAVATPTAAPGHLCVYESLNPFMDFKAIRKADATEAAGASVAGALLEFEAPEEARAWGTWAVTAPSGP